MDDEEETIVSYPAKWAKGTQEFLVESARQAGFQNVRGMDEATASIGAVLVQKQEEIEQLGMMKGNRPFLFLVVDMGAGTTDLAVCRYTPGIHPQNEIISTWPCEDSNILFGGREIDAKLGKYFSEIMKRDGISEKIADTIPEQQADKIKEWKEHTLSNMLNCGETVRYCNFLNAYYNIMCISPSTFSFGKKEFEELLSDYLQQFPELLEGCMADAAAKSQDFTPGEIDMVILTGGHSQWYFVPDMLSGVMTKYGNILLPKIKDDKNRMFCMPRPQEIVSLGLVYQPLVTQSEKTEKKQPETGDDYDPNRQGCAVFMGGRIYYLKENNGERITVCRIREDGSDQKTIYSENNPDAISYTSLYAADGNLYLVSASRILELQCGTWNTRVVDELNPNDGKIFGGSLRIKNGIALYTVMQIMKKKSTLRRTAEIINPILGFVSNLKDTKDFKSAGVQSLRLCKISTGWKHEFDSWDVKQIGIWKDTFVVYCSAEFGKSISDSTTDKNPNKLLYAPIQAFYSEEDRKKIQAYKIENIKSFCVINKKIYLLKPNNFLVPYKSEDNGRYFLKPGPEHYIDGKTWIEEDTVFYLTRRCKNAEKDTDEGNYVFSLSLDSASGSSKEKRLRANVHNPEMITFIGGNMYDYEKGYTSYTPIGHESGSRRLGK